MCVRRHGQSTVCFELSYCVHYTKKTRTLTYVPLNPKHGNMAVTDRKDKKNLHGYHLVKKIHITLNKIAVTDIDYQWIKEDKDMVMGYGNKSSI